jgi:hypothetical protein
MIERISLQPCSFMVNTPQTEENAVRLFTRQVRTRDRPFVRLRRGFGVWYLVQSDQVDIQCLEVSSRKIKHCR